MVGSASGLGRARLIGMNIFEVHGTDTLGIPAHDLNRVHACPSQVAGVRAETEDGLIDAAKDSVDLVLDLDRGRDVRVQHGSNALGRDGRRRSTEAVDNLREHGRIGAGPDRWKLRPDPAEARGNENLGIAQFRLHGRMPPGALGDLLHGLLMKKGGVISGRRDESILGEQVAVLRGR